MNKIILEVNTLKFQDNQVREVVGKLITKIETLNERTKKHTIEIRELNNKLKGEKEWK